MVHAVSVGSKVAQRRCAYGKVVVAIAAAVVVLGLSGCAHDISVRNYNDFQPALTNAAVLQAVTFTNRINPEWLQPPTDFFTLGPGDRVEVDLIGETNASTVSVIGPDGKIYFNLLPGLDVWGLTLGEAKKRLESEMAQYVRDRPQVSLALRGVESKRFWVLGRVQVPGVYPLQTPMTLLEAIANAGGTMSLSSYQDQAAAGVNEDLADLKRSFVLRNGQLLPVDFERLLKEGDVSQNIYLRADDFIYLPAATAREVYVLGAVLQPQRLPYRPGLTVAQAIAGSYGTVRGAYLRHVAVVRGSFQQPRIAIVDYKGVIRGEAADMVLEPNDIVYVPLSPFRYLYKYAELVVNTFVSSAAINAGTSALGEQPVGGAGIYIPVGSSIQVLPPATVPPIQ